MKKVLINLLQHFFFTPDVHKIINSLLFLCFIKKIIIDIKNDKGKILGLFQKYLKVNI